MTYLETSVLAKLHPSDVRAYRRMAKEFSILILSAMMLIQLVTGLKGTTIVTVPKETNTVGLITDVNQGVK
jgi:hypothetical protein